VDHVQHLGRFKLAESNALKQALPVQPGPDVLSPLNQ
jgi:hypothetical protein